MTLFINSERVGVGKIKKQVRGDALLTMIADELAPEAYSRAHKVTGIAIVLGFILSVFLTRLEQISIAMEQQ